jgi:hypothetical protein
MVMDERRRLAPKLETLRRLFALSGNLCAFPACDQILVNRDGVFVAEVCHIEAAEPGGERFNSAQTNEECRAFENLLLLCHRHHVETDDRDAYPVGRLKEMKRDHEHRFSGALEQMRASVSDETWANVLDPPRSLNRMNHVLGWGVGANELAGSIEMLTPMLDRLSDVPRAARDVLLITLQRGDETADGLRVPLPELRQVTNLAKRALIEYVETLARYRLANFHEDFDGNLFVETRNVDGWPFWRDLVAYCRATDIPLSDYVIDLRFDLLDD